MAEIVSDPMTGPYGELPSWLMKLNGRTPPVVVKSTCSSTYFMLVCVFPLSV